MVGYGHWLQNLEVNHQEPYDYLHDGPNYGLNRVLYQIWLSHWRHLVFTKHNLWQYNIFYSSLLATSSEDGSIRLWGQIPDRENDGEIFEGAMERFFNKR